MCHPALLKFAKGAIVQCSDGVGFYSNVCMVPKHTGGLYPLLKSVNKLLHAHAYSEDAYYERGMATYSEV